MELNEFISETIKQVTDGLMEGHEYVKEKSPDSGGIETGTSKINFDIGVQSNEGNVNDVGGKITVAQIFQLRGKSESNSSIQNVNRIQFDVTMHIDHK
ncbi:hypothetical protein [Cyclobacterium salsum]|uniref:hypothetical protein n=1 Tax=Cyclobacterium salsum TaxID=2666329 RepID=UPI00139171C5|nr:hypothetical protein [Cyclobacterium salsum]